MSVALSLFDQFPAAVKSRGELLHEATREIAWLLREGLSVDRTLMSHTMSAAFGDSDGSGAWNARQGYDCVEAAIAKEILRYGHVVSPNTSLPDSALAWLEAIKKRMPTQARRAGNTERLQQFSTPPELAWALVRAAALRESDVVLEPSAGTGLIAAHAMNAGATVHVNEIDPDRRALLELLFANVTAHDAMYLASLYRGPRPTVVVMNPPFSVDFNLPDQLVRGAGLRHVEQALDLLVDGGRLVALVGHNSDPVTRERDFSSIRGKAALRASIAIVGSAYAAMGTAFATRVLVFDKGASQGDVIEFEGESTPREAVRLLEDLPARGIVSPIFSIAPNTNVTAIAPAREKKQHARRTKSVRPAAARRVVLDAPEPVRYEPIESTEATEELGGGAFEVYKPRVVRFIDAKPHPDTLVVSGALSAVSAPVPTATIMLPPSLVRDGVLSEAQLEAILYAAQAHASTIKVIERDADGLPYEMEVRGGFMVGDGGGVGKGRENAGIIVSNMAQGAPKHMWISESADLLEDARRDFAALGGDPDLVFALSDFGPDAIIDRTEGIIFSTMATLRSGSHKSERTRLDQIVEWLGGESFAGGLHLDEAHGASNATPGEGVRGMQKASQQGLAVLDLQRRLPNAKVTYSSATSASKLEALGYAVRLGLWGSGTAFATRDIFMEKMDEGGVAAMEVVCRDMQSLGLYIARTLSNAGVEYTRLKHTLSSAQIELYNASAAAWRTIAKNVDEALKAAGVTKKSALSDKDVSLNGRAKGAARSALYSTEQRFFQALLVSFKMDAVIDDAKKRLAEGGSVVLQLTNTNEAVQERALAKRDLDDSLDDLDMSPKEMIIDYLKNAFPIAQYRRYVDAEGRERSEIMRDEKGDVIKNAEAVAIREALLEKICTLLVPNGVLEMIHDGFGTQNVAEITGRKRRLVWKTVDGETKRVVEERGAHANSADAAMFMNREKRILVFSEAGGTGRSYHASLDCKNQDTRYHYLVQAGWRSDKALQGLMRTHRTHQAQEPKYILVETNVPAEARFMSTIARRLDQLGALTRGQRDAASGGLFSSQDNLETQYGREALRLLLTTISKGEFKSLSCAKFEAQTGLEISKEDGQAKAQETTMPRFLNRLLAVDIDGDGGLQAKLMNALETRMTALVSDAIENGTYDAGVEVIRPLSLAKISDELLHTDEKSGAVTRLLNLEREDPIEFLTFRKALRRLNTWRADGVANSSFFMTPEGIVLRAMVRKEGKHGPYWTNRIQTPSTSRLVKHEDFSGQPISDEDAKIAWNEAIKVAASTYKTRFYVVSGALLPVWDRLPDGAARVYRMSTGEGERIIGRVLELRDMPNVLEAFGKTGRTWSTEEIVAALYSGKTVNFVDGSHARRARLNGQLRIEVSPKDPWNERVVLEAKGVLAERVDYRLRFFIPTGATESEILLKIAGGKPMAIAA